MGLLLLNSVLQKESNLLFSEGVDGAGLLKISVIYLDNISKIGGKALNGFFKIQL
ncbi:hypothetical protein X474_17200 [Dethiosulfatarculus sandiegensis]|uniref:Uncharacterized protein n=1 Tax=Dethiosulfatarculus sandiegensis TaxID=1429043 RepID=A0A0D2HQT4_9BACT|nr:hypothetical protein X474_17200 [Dethiosulfatarculus sandiegensis]